MIRAGRGAPYADDFLSGGFVGVGFSELASDDLVAVGEQVLKARATNAKERVFAGQLSAFAFRVEVGDLVIVPRLPKIRDYLVGQVTGPYRHAVDAPASGHHLRSVKWLGTFDREVLSRPAINTLGAILTIFRPTAVEAELRSLITDLKPVGTDHPKRQGTPEPTLNLRRALLDVELDEMGRAHIACVHPALVMEQVPRHVNPGQGWSGVPGIYVLTGTDLEQASVRTGPERTLTTTLIVRPWAYVGSERGLLGQIGQPSAEQARVAQISAGSKRGEPVFQ